jgi:hypothetical protein
MAGAIDDAHAAFADLAFERVLAEAADLVDLRAQAEDHARRDDRHRDGRAAPCREVDQWRELDARHMCAAEHISTEHDHREHADGADDKRAHRRARQRGGPRKQDVAARQETAEIGRASDPGRQRDGRE